MDQPQGSNSSGTRGVALLIISTLLLPLTVYILIKSLNSEEGETPPPASAQPPQAMGQGEKAPDQVKVEKAPELPPLNPDLPRDEAVAERITPFLKKLFEEKGLELGSPVFIRIFKEESQLEMWVLSSDTNKYKLLKTYPILAWSGKLGPKEKEGDRQAPEGFYFVTASKMNPQSSYHLSFNLGYPNTFDRAHGRTGSFLMVHGSFVSIGCYAMGDPAIEEIYTTVARAFKGGQKFVRVHCFPFRMTKARMKKASEPLPHPTLFSHPIEVVTETLTTSPLETAGPPPPKFNPWLDFWENLKVGYDWFEKHRLPPDVRVTHKTYTFKADK